jgi:transcriptional regulator with XRE-family HTH domain
VTEVPVANTKAMISIPRKPAARAGLTQADLAQMLDMPTTTWAMVERGARRIQPDRVSDIAHALDADPDDLVAAWQRTRDLRERHAQSTRA